MTLQRRWRQWLTDNLVDRWLKSGRYYQLNLVSGDHKNPEYRIADDVRIATESPVDFVSGVTSAFLSAATFIVVLWTIGGALELSIGGTATSTIPGFLVIAAVLYAVIASGAMMLIGRRFVTVSEREEPDRGRAALRADAAARERREHRAHPGRRGGAAGRRPVARQGAAGMALDLLPEHEDHGRLVELRLHRAGAADHPVRAEVSRRLDDARPGDAGGVRLHHRAGRLQLAGRQLSAARRLDRVGPPRRLADGVARRPGARRERRRLRPHQAHRRRRERGAPAARPVGDARRRHRRARRHRHRHHAGRARADRGRIRHRQEHAGARDLRPVALGRRPDRGEEGRQADAAAAAALHPDRHACAARRPIRTPPTAARSRRSPRPSSASGSSISSSASRTRRRGTRPCRAARSSVSPSRASSCTTRTSSCSTRRPLRSIRRARTS